ncbi:hypothetical protein SAMN05216370_0780 [Pseudomonas peli]|uniref:Bacteriophage N4 adsorption protein B n=1 Tax=Pseudomonas peli TaxID=592361 RepID=A0AB37Z4N8_9PSED|nr:hypothetical protein [Pseudomonas peli]NMZ68955.1 hypothetical protein [Pseudomonas peli]SCW37444.1 hypothetical protein SAMN05216370_0780 [Pseudomonas peli]|tara:strand:- start:654 stop:1331 length:678 start_codon:yes stop_codon:yes gene_type:complete
MSSQQNSRLGQVLINKGLINRGQLDAAIQLQLTNHKRLGETLIEQGWLSERQLKKALSKQNNLRLAATLVAALLSPFQIASADAPRNLPSAISQEETPRGLRPLSDMEMSNVSAQGLDDVLQGLFLQAGSGDGLGTVGQLSKLVMPVLSSLEAETSMKDVQYDTSKLTSAINSDGSVNVRLPSSIGELRFDNIRVAGASPGQSFGSLSLHDIDLSQASLRISLHK